MSGTNESIGARGQEPGGASPFKPRTRASSWAIPNETGKAAFFSTIACVTRFGDGKVGVQSLAINLESYALAGAVALTGEKVGRTRPLARECERDATYDRRCGETGRNNASFVSGHTAIAFTGAGLTCVHHLSRIRRRASRR